jgi:predicted dehydrogenase
MAARLDVGVVGASTTGWARDAHLPTLAGLPEYRLAAVATTRQETAEETARAYGAARAYADAGALIGDAAVDVVIICVKVPEHARLVELALRAGKHVYCEWPLGRTVSEAAELARLAGRGGTRHAIGLQARSSPLLGTVRRAITDGLIGTALSCNVYSPTRSGGPSRDLARRYTADRANGAHTLSINTGHTLDTVGWLLGGLESLSALTAVRQPGATVVETGERLRVTAPDQVVVAGRTADGCVVNIHAHSGARPNGARFLLRLFGTAGDLVVSSAGTRGHQIEELSARFCPAGSSTWQELAAAPDAYLVDPPLRAQPVLNVAQALRRFAAAISGGAACEPDFSHAATLHRQLAAVELSDDSGSRQASGTWAREASELSGALGAAQE